MQSNHFKRLLDLLTLLQAGHGAKVEFLAESLECSQRTVFRDLELLKASGVQLSYDSQTGGYAIDSAPAAPLSPLSEEEWLAVLMAASISSLSRSTLFAGSVNQAIAKLMIGAPDRVRERFKRLVRAVVNESELPDLDDVQSHTLRVLIDAIDQRKRVLLKLEDAKTVFSPYRTVYRGGAWSIEGRSSLHEGQIDIPLRSIQHAELLTDSYHVPAAYLQSGHTGSRILSILLRGDSEPV